MCRTNETELTYVSCNFLFDPLHMQGLTFGDFTAEEWEKYFSNSVAQTGHLPAVEVFTSLLDFSIFIKSEFVLNLIVSVRLDAST